jgi:hypothetical protein
VPQPDIREWRALKHFNPVFDICDSESTAATQVHIPAAFFRLSQSLQNFGQVIAARGSFPPKY